MNRLELLQKIEAVEPALADKQTLPILSHLWFTGRHVMAYNDGIAISASLPTEFKAAVPPLLIKLLRASMATEVDIALKARGELAIKASAARMSVPTFPCEDFAGIFKMPEVKAADADKVIVTGDADALQGFFAALEFAGKSVANEATVPEQLGVTLIPAGKRELALCSTNEKALFYTRIKIENPLAKRLTVSGEFVKQMLALRKLADSYTLYVFDDYALFKAGIYSLFGKLIFSQAPLDFDKALKQHFPDMNDDAKLAPVKGKLAMILERACIVVGDNDVEATVKNDEIRFKSMSGDNTVNDVMEFKAQQAMTIKFSPAIAKLAVDAGMDRMRITERCVLFTKEDWVFMVTAKV